MEPLSREFYPFSWPTLFSIIQRWNRHQSNICLPLLGVRLTSSLARWRNLPPPPGFEKTILSVAVCNDEPIYLTNY